MKIVGMWRWLLNTVQSLDAIFCVFSEWLFALFTKGWAFCRLISHKSQMNCCTKRTGILLHTEYSWSVHFPFHKWEFGSIFLNVGLGRHPHPMYPEFWFSYSADLGHSSHCRLLVQVIWYRFAHFNIFADWMQFKRKSLQLLSLYLHNAR